MKDHDLVDTVDELWPELRLHLAHHRHFHQLVIVTTHLLDHLRAKVGGHDDDRILEVHRAPLAVGHATVVEHLQQHIKHIRVRLLNFVEQDHGIRFAPHRFGQVAALFIADIAGRRADQAGDRMLLHEFTHVDTDHVFFRIKEEFRQRLA